MPEGPELMINSIFINNVCRGLVFGGRPIRSSVSKSPEIEWDSSKYTITSESRGKELSLLLQCQEERDVKTRLLFRFGMSGKFIFTGVNGIPKHAHLQFRVVPKNVMEEPNVLSFVDPRRFGSWHLVDGWGEGRGPDIMNEYETFRANVLGNLEDSVFKKPICEALLSQKYFNGIGNYLRAEILFRAKIPPFTRAREVLASLEEEDKSTDVLRLCRDVSQESIQLKVGLGKAENQTKAASKEDHAVFMNWLQCYNNPSMNVMKDRIGRSIWFHGDPGSMAPKGGKMKASQRKRVAENPYPITTVIESPEIKKAKTEKEDVTVPAEEVVPEVHQVERGSPGSVLQQRKKSRNKESFVVQMRRSARLRVKNTETE